MPLSFTCVSTMDELRSLPSPEAQGQYVEVLGYWQEGDDGGGSFRWDRTVTPSDEDGGIIIRPTGLASTVLGGWRRLPCKYISPRWFGAKGNGTTNDTRAFRCVARVMNKTKGGTIFIPAGTYLVGEQREVAKALHAADILHIKDCTLPVTIYGNGARLKAAPTLKIGLFKEYATPAAAYRMILLEANTSVVIRDLELDGNKENLSIGSRYSFIKETGQYVAETDADKGYLESAGYGIVAQRNGSVRIENVYTHDHVCDGVSIEVHRPYDYSGLSEHEIAQLTLARAREYLAEAHPHTLIGVISERNGRCGLSWLGGNSLTAVGCRFNNCGLGDGKVFTSPRCSIDIEDEAIPSSLHNQEPSGMRRGTFIGCEFLDSNWAAPISRAQDVVFENCLFSGSEYYTLSVSSNSSRIFFRHCNIRGRSVLNARDGAFHHCLFEDGAEQSAIPQGGESLLSISGGPTLFDSCLISAHRSRGVTCSPVQLASSTNPFSLGDPIYAEPQPIAMFRNTTIRHGWAELAVGEWQSSFNGAYLENVRFEEWFAEPHSSIAGKEWRVGGYPHGYHNVLVNGLKTQAGSVHHVKWYEDWYPKNWPIGMTGQIGTTQELIQPALILRRKKYVGPYIEPIRISGNVERVGQDLAITSGSNRGDIALETNPTVDGHIGEVLIALPNNWKPFGKIER